MNTVHTPTTKHLDYGSEMMDPWHSSMNDELVQAILLLESTLPRANKFSNAPTPPTTILGSGSAPSWIDSASCWIDSNFSGSVPHMLGSDLVTTDRFQAVAEPSATVSFSPCFDNIPSRPPTTCSSHRFLPPLLPPHPFQTTKNLQQPPSLPRFDLAPLWSFSPLSFALPAAPNKYNQQKKTHLT